tara:strand:- start:444 stop:1136 length:693 start_codon:yes stop_codon:yes gene_type:complete
MKIFDYKFLILLALTLVVYFLFREINDLKSKVKELESVENRKLHEIKEPVVEKPKELFQIPLPKTRSPVPNLIHNEVESEDEVDSQELLNTGDKVAIYSNDDERTDSYSLEDSSILEELEEMDNLEKLEEVIQEVNLDTKDSVEEEKLEDNLDQDEKKKTLLVESEGDTNVKIEDLSYNDFMRYKLNELQCFAEEYNVEIKKSNGKKKTKTELSKDLFQHFSGNKNNLKI